jgi:hypothetical protein
MSIALVMLAGCSDSSDSCTLAGCTSGFSISLVAAEPLRDGTYDLELTLDGVAATCQHVIADGQSVADAECNRRSLVRSTASIYNNGAPPNNEAPNAFVIDIFDAAALVELRVLRDGAPLVEQSYEPSYRTVAPNGPECGPICNTASPQQSALTFD